MYEQEGQDSSRKRNIQRVDVFRNVGALVSSLCCLTPLAVLGLSMAGLGYLSGYIDSFAIPLFAVSRWVSLDMAFFEGHVVAGRDDCQNTRKKEESGI